MKSSNILYCLGSLAIVPVVLIYSPLSKRDQHILPSKIITQNITQEKGLAKVIALAEAFKATLNTDQQALLQRAYSKADATKWSNFPQAATRPARVGLSLKSLNANQRAAFQVLMGSVLAQNKNNEGLDEMNGVMAGDDYFGKATGKSDMFGSDNFFIAFLGVPSATAMWELQFGGHHFAFADTYNKGQIIGTTPSFRGVEPMKVVTVGDKTYQPIDQERQAFANMVAGLSDTEKSTAKLSTSFSDILLGPGMDAQFPNNKQGLKAGGLKAGTQQLILKAIELYIGDLDPVTAKTIMNKYTAELTDTFVAYSGSGTMDKSGDYIRIDGPGVWIEYSVQPSRDFPGTTHPHSVWRDHHSDYGGN